MSMTLDDIRLSCQHARELMRRTREQKFAVGAFNVDNQETLKAICQAAHNLSSPVLAEASHGEVEAIGFENLRDLVTNYKQEFNIEIYINLDHCPSVESAQRGIDCGFEFVHIDISQANHDASDEEIISATKQVVEYAKKTGALVESEPHYFQGSSNLHAEAIDYEELKKTFSTPQGAKSFQESTGIDTFAAAIGNLHGRYPVPKQLDIELLKEIRDAISCNISLHGGSGTPSSAFEQAVSIGVSKININSDLRYTYRTTLEKVLQENPQEYAIVKLMPPVIETVQTVVEEKIHIFHSEGKAVLS